jgi:2-iminoacetate synthase ThiH
MFGLSEIIYLNNLAAEAGDRAVLALIRQNRIEGRQSGVVRIEEARKDITLQMGLDDLQSVFLAANEHAASRSKKAEHPRLCSGARPLIL